MSSWPSHTKIPNPDPFMRGTDPRIRIRIRTKMSRICNTVCILYRQIYAERLRDATLQTNAADSIIEGSFQDIWLSNLYSKRCIFHVLCCAGCSMELTSSAREVRTRPGYTANELNELYCLRCHDKMGIPICGACRSEINFFKTK
jgi:hypothetical protein